MERQRSQLFGASSEFARDMQESLRAKIALITAAHQLRSTIMIKIAKNKAPSCEMP